MWIGIDRRIEFILNESVPSMLRALNLFQLQVAFHVADAPRENSVDSSIRLRVHGEEKLFRQASVLAACKLMERLDREDIETRTLLRNKLFERLMRQFRSFGGFKALRYAPHPQDFDDQIGARVSWAHDVGRIADICLRAPAPGPGSRRRNRITTALTVLEEQENRRIFRVQWGPGALKKRYGRFKHVLPFTYAAYVGTGKRPFMLPPPVRAKNFVNLLLAKVENRNGLLTFCARYNETCRRLSALGYNYQLITPPEGVVLPEVDLALKPWPADVVL